MTSPSETQRLLLPDLIAFSIWSQNELLCLTANGTLMRVNLFADVEAAQVWLDLRQLESEIGQVHSFERIDKDKIVALTGDHFVMIRRKPSGEAEILHQIHFEKIHPQLQAMERLIAGTQGAWAVGALYDASKYGGIEFKGRNKPFLPLHAKDIQVIYLPYEGVPTNGNSILPYRNNFTLLSVDDEDALYFQAGQDYAKLTPDNPSVRSIEKAKLFAGHTSDSSIGFFSQTRFLASPNRWPGDDAGFQVPFEPPRAELRFPRSAVRRSCSTVVVGS